MEAVTAASMAARRSIRPKAEACAIAIRGASAFTAPPGVPRTAPLSAAFMPSRKSVAKSSPQQLRPLTGIVGDAGDLDTGTQISHGKASFILLRTC